MIKSTLKNSRYCPLVKQGFSNFLGLFQGIMANPVKQPIDPITIDPITFIRVRDIQAPGISLSLNDWTSLLGGSSHDL